MAEDLTHKILIAFQDNPLGDAARDITWLFSACEAVHFIGLTIMAGALLIIDLRILGFIRQADHRTVEKLIPLAVLGFALNLISGVTLFASDPFMYWPNPAFKLKLLFIAIAGANAIWFAFLTSKHRWAQALGPKKPMLLKIAAICSLVGWLLVILLGRLLPTFEVVG
ncbi:MAG: hypothetical protein ABIO39_00275 [Caulobacteraceae bacterium]